MLAPCRAPLDLIKEEHEIVSPIPLVDDALAARKAQNSTAAAQKAHNDLVKKKQKHEEALAKRKAEDEGMDLGALLETREVRWV